MYVKPFCVSLIVFVQFLSYGSPPPSPFTLTLIFLYLVILFSLRTVSEYYYSVILILCTN